MSEINILNGDALKQYLSEKFDFHGNNVISFNECLSDGDAHKNIFSDEFFDVRANFISNNYGVSQEDYISNTADKLRYFINNKFDKVILWFDYDMFCQINMLTVLAYLEYTKFDGKVEVNIIDQDFYKHSSIEEMITDKIMLSYLNNYYELYVDVLIDNNFSRISDKKYTNNFKEIPYLKQGVELYSEYKTSNSEIKEFINNRLGMDRYDMLVELLNNFRNYGLGDLQFIKILDEMNIK